MNSIMVPAFRAGTYSDGLRRAVAALGDLARGPRRAAPPASPPASASRPAGGSGPGVQPAHPSLHGGGGYGGGGVGGVGGGGIGGGFGGCACCIAFPVLLIGLLSNRLRRFGGSGPWIQTGSGHQTFGGWSGGSFGGSFGGSSGGGFSSGGGGGGGGSFGGGFSGGGGASGSW
jgi:hypothetical protein